MKRIAYIFFAMAAIIAIAADTGMLFMSAEARGAYVKLADRELKRRKNYHQSDIYARAHKIIYGEKGNFDPDGRIRIAVVINGDENIIVEDSVKNEIYKQLRKKFPYNEFAVMKGIDVNTKLLQWAEDKAVALEESMLDRGVYDQINGIQPRVDADGMPREIQPSSDVPDIKKYHNRRVNQPLGISNLHRRDYVRAGRECGYDYIFLATFNNGLTRDERHQWVLFEQDTRKHNVWLRMRFVDMESGDYLYRNDIVMQGETAGKGKVLIDPFNLVPFWYGSGHSRAQKMAVGKALEEALKDLEVVLP